MLITTTTKITDLKAKNYFSHDFRCCFEITFFLFCKGQQQLQKKRFVQYRALLEM